MTNLTLIKLFILGIIANSGLFLLTAAGKLNALVSPVQTDASNDISWSVVVLVIVAVINIVGALIIMHYTWKECKIKREFY